ncbi:MAG: SCO family protein [Planctomycetota bacterium]|jgi:protein SCO1/2
MADPVTGETNHRADTGAGLAVPAAALAVTLALAAVVGVTIWRSRGTAPQPAPPRKPIPEAVAGVDPAVPAFALTDQHGAAIAKSGPELAGKVWVVGFIFTRCATVCPRVTQAMVDLQATLPSPDVRFVAVSVDPHHDTPAVLRDYARSFGVDDRWHFLTGDKAKVYDLIEQGFRLAVDEAPDPTTPVELKFVHSDRLALVDRQGMVRHYVRGTEAEGVATVPGLVATLLAEPAK